MAKSINVDDAVFNNLRGDVHVDRGEFRLVFERDSRWRDEVCGSCEFFRRAVVEEITVYAGTCREASIGADGFPRTTDTTPACGRWQEA